jgi:hypothetical protein
MRPSSTFAQALCFITLCFITLWILVPLGCADKGKTPSTPAVDRFALSGRIRLDGKLADEADAPLGIRRVEDASGVMVHLSGAGGMRDSTQTVSGGYSFQDLAPGSYRLAIWVVPSHPDTTSVTVVDRDVATPDTLVLAPNGDIRNYPNPSTPDGIGTEFTTHSVQTYSVEVRSPAGDLVWTYSQTDVPAGYYHVHWDGDDLTDHVAPNGPYWIIVHADGGEIYGLAFWDQGSSPPNPGNCGHIDASGLQVEENGTAIVREWLGIQGGELSVAAGDSTPELHLGFIHPDSTVFAVADTCPENHMTWEFADSTVASIKLLPGRKWTFRLLGRRIGQTELTLSAWHQAHIHLSSQPIPIVVRASN